SRVAQWKRAGPITQRSEDQNLALLFFFLPPLSLLNLYWFNTLATWIPGNSGLFVFVGFILMLVGGAFLKNPKLLKDTRSRVAQWKRAGPITQRSEDQNLALLYSDMISLDNSEELLWIADSRYRFLGYVQRLGFVSTYFLQCYTMGKKYLICSPYESRVAQWKRAGPITQRSEDQNLALLIF
ncbi:unnamed protein product, partial [Porites evermanni]